MQNIFFTSDTHYGHANILTFMNRPFTSLDDMHEEMIKRWNSLVSKGDIVYHLGDFCMFDKKRTNQVLYALNGTIRLVKGNHDKIIKGDIVKRFDWIKDYYEAKAPDGRKIILCHYPFQVWNKSHYGSWHLHGHSHGSLAPWNVKRLDVGVDTNDFYPYSMDKIEKLMSLRGIIQTDHHKPRDKYK